MADKADKRKRACITVGYGPDGKPVKKWVAGKTRAELEQKKKEILSAYRSDTDTQKLTFCTYATQWYKVHTANLSYSINQTYKSLLNHQIFPKIAHIPINQVKHSQLQGLLNGR